MPEAFTLAHLSDIHLAPLPRLDWQHANVKRILGFLNWHKSRRRCHLPTTLARITADLATQAPDHIAVTGDLINIGLPAEYAAAAHWLARLGPPDRVTVVPGNHDIYTHLAGDPGIERWRPYMTGDQPSAPTSEATAGPAQGAAGHRRAEGFPFERRFGAVALIGVNSALPTRPFYAGGTVGPVQLQCLARLLERLGKAGALRVVLIHHPPLPGLAKPAKALADAADLRAVLVRHGAELVLFGHNHVRTFEELETTSGCRLNLLGAASASLGQPHKAETLASYSLLRFEPGHDRVTMTVRGLTHADGDIKEIERRTLRLSEGLGRRLGQAQGTAPRAGLTSGSSGS